MKVTGSNSGAEAPRDVDGDPFIALVAEVLKDHGVPVEAISRLGLSADVKADLAEAMRGEALS